jgi:hypothetical protein
MTEADLTKKIISAMQKEGALAVKIHGGTFQSRGLPDVVSCFLSHFIGLEVKLPGKEDTISDLQRKKLWAIYDAGGIGYMVTTVSQVLRILQEVRNGHRFPPNVEPYQST